MIELEFMKRSFTAASRRKARMLQKTEPIKFSPAAHQIDKNQRKACSKWNPSSEFLLLLQARKNDFANEN